MKLLHRKERTRNVDPSEAPPLDRVNHAIDHGSYRYSTIEVRDAVQLSVEGRWDVPDFQRSFVWKPSQICDLADSLWRGYPTGALMLWKRPEVRGREDLPLAWIADGQQRLTSMCAMAAAPAFWMTRRGSTNGIEDVEILFDAAALRPPHFIAVSSRARTNAGANLVPLRKLLTLDLSEALARDKLLSIASKLHGHAAPNASVIHNTFVRLTRAAAISRRELLVTNLACAETREVLEIFRRLNSRGMRYRRLLLKLVTARIRAFRI
jgi:Protein of unknown function DUF262